MWGWKRITWWKSNFTNQTAFRSYKFQVSPTAAGQVQLNVSTFRRNVLTPFLAWLDLIQVHSVDAVKITPTSAVPFHSPGWPYLLQPCHVPGTFLSSSSESQIQMLMKRKFLRYRRRSHLCTYVRLHRAVLYLLIKCLFYYPKHTTIWIFRYIFYHILTSFIILQFYILV